METRFLLPSKFKKIGWIILIPSSILGLLKIFSGFELESLDLKMFTICSGMPSPFFRFGFDKVNLTGTIIGVLFILGAVMVAFSREKVEDEFISKRRLESFLWATYINYAILLFCFLFFYGTCFLYVMIFVCHLLKLSMDFDTFASGLRASLRQAPKVILVGEMRDRETVEIGLSAAETGHLLLTTLHTVDAGQTINRILGMFSIEEENQIRIRLAETVRWIVCQRLLPKVGGGRVAAFEILGSNLRVKDSILHGESEGKTFYEIIEAGEAFGMTTFDKYIVGLYEKGLITEETSMAYASQKGVVGRGIDAVKSTRGEATTDIEELEVDKQYGKGKK